MVVPYFFILRGRSRRGKNVLMNIKVTINNKPSEESMKNFMIILNQILDHEREKNSILYKQAMSKYNGTI